METFFGILIAAVFAGLFILVMSIFRATRRNTGGGPGAGSGGNTPERK